MTSRRAPAHLVQFYDDDEALASAVAAFVAPGLAAGHVAVMIATADHRTACLARLDQLGVGVDQASRDGRLRCLDARETLDQFMVESMPDERRFNAVIGGVIETCIRAGPSRAPVRAYGEMVDLLWRDNNRAGALRLEELCNDLALQHPFSLLCTYSMASSYRDAYAAEIDRIFREHALHQGSEALEPSVQHHEEVETRLGEAADASQHLAAIVASSDDAIVSKDLNGIVTSWNSAAEQIFGYTAAEAIGKSIRLIIPPERWPEEDMVLGRVRRGEAVSHFETVRRRKDGRDVHISLTVSPIKDMAGTITGASKIARDVTERKRFEADRERLLARAEQARADAEQANRVKDDFLATLSHELRSPLNAISGWAQLAAAQVDERHDPTIRRALDVIQRNVNLQLRLINDLLDVSSIVSGKLPLRYDVVDLTVTIAAVVDSMRPQAVAKGLHVDVRLKPNRSHVIGDATRLEQVIWNLLSNALKFTPRGGHVTVTLDRIGQDVRVSVQDTGEGIAPAFLPHVFDRFRQADATTTRRHGGLGLGLAVAQHLVQAHRGRITARSPGPGLGSTFTVELPAASEIGASSQAGLDEPAIALEGARLLVVDDDADARDLLESILRRHGVSVTAVASVEEALEALELAPYDAVLSDLAMPRQDGYLLIQSIRRDIRPQVRQVAAMAVTAHADDAYRTRALASGFDDYMTKPVEAVRLVRLIDTVMRRRRAIDHEG